MSEVETRKKFEELRKDSIKKALGTEKPKDKEIENKEIETISDDSEKKLDIDENNSYIKDDPENEQLKSIVEKTFGGDPYKAVKSWREAQSAFTQLRNQYKNVNTEYEEVLKVMDGNPKLKELFEKAYQGEDIQNFFEKTKEPDGKPNSFDESKLKNSTDEKTLVQAGLLDPTELSLMTDVQKAATIRQAQLSYLEKTLPERLAKETAERLNKQIAEQEQAKKEQQSQEENKRLNNARWKTGIETVAQEYGLNFTGDDQPLLDEIERYAKFYRDPDNPNVIDEEAVLLATQRVARLKNIKLDKKEIIDTTKQKAKEQIDATFGKGFNTSTKQPLNTQNKPVTLADKLRQRRIEESVKALEKRNSYRNQK